MDVNAFCFKDMLFIRRTIEHSYRDTFIAFAVQLRLLDVAVLFDWSTSFRGGYWNFILNYVRGFVNKLGISPDPRATHVSMIGYSSSPSVIFNFKAPQNIAYVRRRLNSVTRQPGYRRPDKALELARTALFTASGGYRMRAQKVS